MAKIYHADLWGSREDKYRYLQENDINTVEWTELTPEAPFYMFIPQDTDCRTEYQSNWKITDIFPINNVSIMTARDSLTIQWSRDGIWSLVNDFAALSSEEARSKYSLGKDTRDWLVINAQKDLKELGLSEQKLAPILYRPFDIRHTYYTGKWKGFHSLPRWDVMQHILMEDNIGLIANRQVRLESIQHFLVSDVLVERHILETANASAYFFPLYVYCLDVRGTLFDFANLSSISTQRRSNLSKEVIEDITSKLGYIPTPEAIFYYIYAIFHSPTYRQRYAEFLKIDFPRVPLTSSDQLFKDLGVKGQALVDLHLMKSKKLNKLITKMGGDGDNAVTEVTYKPTGQRVYINKSRYFEGIAADVWEFKIGGYQMLDKWLKDRKKAKRTLSFNDVLHYQKVVVALKETMQLMQEIDQLIPSFPIE